MILVDNFKIILVVGLICAAGISPSDALMCKKDDGMDDTCDAAKTSCRISKTAAETGCATTEECAGAIGDVGKFKCGIGLCCCGEDGCNVVPTTPGTDQQGVCASLLYLNGEKGCPIFTTPPAATQTPAATPAAPAGTQAGGGGGDGDATTVNGTGDASGATGLENYFGGIPLITLLMSASLCMIPMKAFA